MNAEQLDSILEEFPPMARRAAGVLHEHIIEAATAAIEEATRKGKQGTLKLSITVTVSLGKEPRIDDVEAAVGIRYTASGLEPEPETPDLPGIEVSIVTTESPKRRRGKNKGAELKADD